MRIQLIVAAALGAGLLVGCGAGSAPVARGQVAIHSAASARATATSTTPVCASFTLQPFVPAADGAPNPAGSPVQLTSSLGGNATDAIIGCIDGPNDAAGYNWGYIVTATNFSQCGATPGTLGAPLTNVYPATTTFIVPVHCRAGFDVSVQVQAEVSVATPNAGGYIDITTSVNATTVQTGCKQADLNLHTDRLLHFGESYISSDGSVATGLVAVDQGAPRQFGGTVNAPGGGLDTYYTGTVNPAGLQTVYQTFISPCTGAGQVYAAINHAQCVSDATGIPSGTTAGLADAFVEKAGAGFAAASVVNGGLTIYSSFSSTGPATMTAGASFAPAYNPLTVTTIPSTDPSLGTVTVTGVFVDQGNALQFLVSGTDATGAPLYATLSQAGGAWTLGSFALVDSFAINCNGLYSHPDSCFAPKDCSRGAGNRVALPPPPINLLWLFVAYSGDPSFRPLITLATPGEPNLTLNPGSFAFANKKPWGSTYNVTLVSSPAGVTCVIPSPTGTMTGTYGSVVGIYCGPAAWKDVSVGYLGSHGIATDGTLWAWGNAYYNTLGGPNVSGTPTKIGTDTDWKRVWEGYSLTVAQKNDGTLWTFGDNWAAGLGTGVAGLVATPTKIGTDTDWKEVGVTFNSEIFALKNNGTLWHWGADAAFGFYSGCTAPGSCHLTPVQIGTATNWKSLAGSSSSEDVVILKNDNTAWSWGPHTGGSLPQQINNDTDWASAGVALGTVYLIKQSGTLWGFAFNLSNPAVPSPTGQVGVASDWAQVGAMLNTVGGVRTNGDLYVWGDNAAGQIGNGTTVASATPVFIGSGYKAYAPGFMLLSLGLKTDNSLRGWGSNSTYNMGAAWLSTSSLPVLIP